MSNPFVSRIGNNSAFEIPEPDTHHGILVGIIDLGTHENEYQGKVTQRRTCMMLWELSETRKTDGSPFLASKIFTLSSHSESALVKTYERWHRQAFNPDDQFDPQVGLGQPWAIPITHKQVTKDGKPRAYAIVGDPGPVRRGTEVPPATTCQPFTFFIGGELPVPRFDWLPRVYGKTVVELITSSPEWKQLPADHPQKRSYRPTSPVATRDYVHTRNVADSTF